MDAWQLALQNLKDTPSGISQSWPFVLGMSGLEFLQMWTRSMLPQDQSTTSYMIVNNLLLGTLDTAKFVYWGNYQPQT